MSVLDYCCRVQEQVTAAKPKPPAGDIDQWFGDTGRASRAVSLALECNDCRALRIAEPLAERYGA